MKLEEPLSSYVSTEDLAFKSFMSYTNAASSVIAALEVLDNKLSDDEFVEANAVQIAQALSSIVYKFGGCLIWGKYHHSYD